MRGRKKGEKGGGPGTWVTFKKIEGVEKKKRHLLV